MNWLSLSEQAAQVVVDGLWQGALVTLLVALGLRVLPRVSAAQRFVIWVLGFGLAAAVPFLPVATGGGQATSGTAVLLGESWAYGIAGLWLAAMVWRSVRLALEARRVRRIWREARPVEVSAELSALLTACPRDVEICSSDQVNAPSVIGFRSPRLLVPRGLVAELTAAELRQIVLHECEHLRRRDDWLNLLQKVALAVFPLNPALLFVDRRLGRERELACDAGVVTATGSALEYASCLTRLAEHRLGRSSLALALSAWAQRSELSRRVYALLRPARRVSQAGARAALATMACVLMATADGVAHTPALVSFTRVARSSPLVAAGPPAVLQALPVVSPTSESHPESLRMKAVLVSAVAPFQARSFVRDHVVIRCVRRSARAPQLMAPITIPAFSRMAPSYPVPVKISYSYAAVPFGDGWLIVQL